MASDDAQLALQKGIVAALRTHTDAGASVYDIVPASSPFPRITIGPTQVVPNPADCMDGSETLLQIDVWSVEEGYVQAKRIAGQVRAILHDASMTLDGHDLQLMVSQSTNYLRDPDGLTAHAAMIFRALTQPT